MSLVLAVALVATPALAGTKDDLESARARLDRVHEELHRATAELQAAYDRYQDTLGRIAETKATIARVKARIARIQKTLAARARNAYKTGAAGTLHLLLASTSIAEFSDRVEFLGAVQENDATLVVQAQVNRERLDRERARLAELSAQQADVVRSLREQEAVVAARFHEAEELVAKLTAKLREEEAERRRLELLGQVIRRGPGLQRCPVAGPNSFVDSFGAPRSGGRTHAGTDLIALFGTPVVAAQSGNAVQNSSSLGGLAVYVYGDGGDMTYYAHVSSYGATGHVSAGTVIGYVGSTGNAGSVNHLHFEYHPGGGGAVNPYPYLLQVC